MRNNRVLCPVVKCIINAIIRDESHKDFLRNGSLNDSFGNFLFYLDKL